MGIIDIDLEGVKNTLYVDNELYNRIITQIKPKLDKKDFDWFWIVDGSEGVGKSVFAFQLAKIVDPSFCLERVCMNPEEFTKAVIKAEKKQAVVFDEAFTGLSSRASLTEINRLMISLCMEMRQKNLFVIIVMPTIFMLDVYMALFRSKGLFHVYLKDGRRGRWCFYNNTHKRQLYLLGKKMFSYARPRSNLRGRFTDKYMVNETQYREKKRLAFEQKSFKKRNVNERFREQRDKLIKVVYNLGYSCTRISNLCKSEGINLHRTTISKIIHGENETNTTD